MKFNTPKEFYDQVGKFVEENADTLFSLKDRWQDEKEYEDFEDYKKVIENRLSKYDLKLFSIKKSFTMKFLYEKTHIVEVKVPLSGNLKISLTPLNNAKIRK